MTPPARLLRFHRNDLANLLIVGGSAAQRLGVAHAFHGRGRTRSGSLVFLDARSDEGRLRAALQNWISDSAFDRIGDSLRLAEQGTLYVDAIDELSLETQRMLLDFARRRVDRHLEGDCLWSGRLAVGSAEPLAAAVARGAFSSALYDTLDKVLIELPIADTRTRRADRRRPRPAAEREVTNPSRRHEADVPSRTVERRASRTSGARSS